MSISTTSIGIQQRSNTFRIEWITSTYNTKSDNFTLEPHQNGGKSCCVGVKHNQRLSRYVIFFVSRCRMQSGYEVAEVFITTLAAATRLPMTAATVAGARVFSHEIQEWRPPVTFTFWASVVETVPNYSFRLCDSLASDQLWKSASDGLFTDIKFHVGERTFHAHKAIVAARSPVMMAMFACDMTESRTNSVKIDDFDPVVFERFLSFLYTGTLDRTMSQREELYAIADKYQVDTLKNLCQPAPAELDASELTSLILFL